MIPASPIPPPAWYAVHTRSRHERLVLEQLLGAGYRVYLPEYWGWSRRRDRRKRIKKPLFPGYLFVHTSMTPELRLGIIKARSVVRVVGAGNRPQPVPDREIESIRRLLDVSSDAAPHPYLTFGKKVMVQDGPLAGVVGVVTGEKKKKIVVQVEILGRAVAARLDACQLAPWLE
jgi:transcriptional antiterminator NusG